MVTLPAPPLAVSNEVTLNAGFGRAVGEVVRLILAVPLNASVPMETSAPPVFLLVIVFGVVRPVLSATFTVLKVPLPEIEPFVRVTVLVNAPLPAIVPLLTTTGTATAV